MVSPTPSILRKVLRKAILIFILIFLTNCGESYYVINQKEIVRAYSKFDSRFIPGLQKVALKETRNIQANALYYLGRYRCDYLFLDEETAETRKWSLDIENFLYQYYNETSDFNLKNLASAALACDSYNSKKAKPISAKVATWLIKQFIASERLEISLNFVRLFKKQLTNKRLTLTNFQEEQIQKKLFALLNQPKMDKHTHGVKNILTLIILTKNGANKVTKFRSEFLGSYREVILKEVLEKK